MLRTLSLTAAWITCSLLAGQVFTPLAQPNLWHLQDGAMDFGDFEGDGYPDLYLAGYDSSLTVRNRTYRNNGTTWTPVDAVFGFHLIGGGQQAVDIDLDGDVDLVRSGIDPFINLRTRIDLNNGDGTFAPYTTTNLPGLQGGSLVVADMNGDDGLDIVLTGNDGQLSTIILYNNGNNAWPNTGSVASLPGVADGGVAVADVDGDGDTDVALAGITVNNVRLCRVYLNNGSGTFTPVTDPTLVPVSGAHVQFSDVDGDDDADLLVSGTADGFIMRTDVYLNTGNGSFTTSTNTGLVGLNAASAVMGDVDLDGDPDLLMAGTKQDFTHLVGLYLNDGTGDFGEPITALFPQVYGGTVAMADVDADGDLDAALTGVGPDDEAGHGRIYINGLLTTGTTARNTHADMVWLDLGSAALQVRVSDAGTTRVQVLDMNGKHVMGGQTAPNTLLHLPLHALPAGPYLVQVLGSGGLRAYRVVRP